MVNIVGLFIIKIAINIESKYKNWGFSSVGRAPDLHSGGHRFDGYYFHEDKTYLPLLA